jgi:hypothetical protein
VDHLGPVHVGQAQIQDDHIGPVPGHRGPPPGVTPIGAIHEPERTTVEGRVRVVEVRSVEQNSVLAAEISDSTGDLTALFYGRSHIPGLICGARVRFRAWPASRTASR